MKPDTTETIDRSLLDLDLRDNAGIFDPLLRSQQRAFDAVQEALPLLDEAVTQAASRLCDQNDRPSQQQNTGRLVMVGAGASGRLAIQDGAELWPTFSWPHERLLCCIAGGQQALTNSLEGVEDQADEAHQAVEQHAIGADDVVVAVAASGRSPWTVEWLRHSVARGALGVGIAGNPGSPLLEVASCPIGVYSGAEVLAGSTRMAAGTAQKIVLNLFSTTLMIRLNRTYGNLMVDMGAVNTKLDERRVRLLREIQPHLTVSQAQQALHQANGWIKLAALVAAGDTPEQGRQRLERFHGALRAAMSSQVNDS